MKSKTTRIAAASVLAIALPLAPTAALASSSTPATDLSSARAIFADVDRYSHDSRSGISPQVAESLLQAVGSAASAATEAVAAIEAVGDATVYSVPQAAEQLQDAKTAVEAALGECVYALALVAEGTAPHAGLAEIVTDLHRLLLELG